MMVQQHTFVALMLNTFQNNTITNIYRMQGYKPTMCGYFCIVFVDFMFKSKTMACFTNLFWPQKFKESEEVILNCFLKNKINMS